MPAKKLTAQKREELKYKKQKANSPSYLKSILTLIIVITVIAIAAYAAFLFLGSQEPIDDNTPPVVQNNAPIAVGDYALFALNSSNNTLDLLMNDADADQDSLNITEVATPSNGIAEIVDKKLIYTPNQDYTGVEQFTYTITDGKDTITSNVNIVVANDSVVNGEYPIALIDTSEGMIVLELYDDEAPKTCENFIKLVNDGFYDGMIFHRVLDDFMIQAGSVFPDGTRKSSPYGNIDFEGLAQGNDASHVEGAISMASTAPGVGGSSEFFIMDAVRPDMDSSYAAFGKTIYGIEVVRGIADEPHDGSFGDVGGGKPTSGDIIINSIKMIKN